MTEYGNNDQRSFLPYIFRNFDEHDNHAESVHNCFYMDDKDDLRGTLELSAMFAAADKDIPEISESNDDAAKDTGITEGFN